MNGLPHCSWPENIKEGRNLKGTLLWGLKQEGHRLRVLPVVDRLPRSRHVGLCFFLAFQFQLRVFPARFPRYSPLVFRFQCSPTHWLIDIWRNDVSKGSQHSLTWLVERRASAYQWSFTVNCSYFQVFEICLPTRFRICDWSFTVNFAIFSSFSNRSPHWSISTN